MVRFASIVMSVLVASPALAFDKSGVRECDEFLAKFEVCLAKMDSKNRESYQEVFDSFEEQWKELATDDQVRSMLPQTCEADNESLAETLTKDFGCEF